MRRTHLFLTELVLDLFLFAVCAAVCAGLLLRARGMSRESRRLTEAVYAAQTIAEQWRATRLCRRRAGLHAGGGALPWISRPRPSAWASSPS